MEVFVLEVSRLGEELLETEGLVKLWVNDSRIVVLVEYLEQFGVSVHEGQGIARELNW